MPALLTKPCRPPKLSAAATTSTHSASLVTSWRMNVALLPRSAASFLPSSSRTSPITTLAPSATSIRASAAPCPRAPPLIRTTLLSNRAMISSLCRRIRAPFHALGQEADFFRLLLEGHSPWLRHVVPFESYIRARGTPHEAVCSDVRCADCLRCN